MQVKIKKIKGDKNAYNKRYILLFLSFLVFYIYIDVKEVNVTILAIKISINTLLYYLLLHL